MPTRQPSSDAATATKVEMRRVARAQMERGVRQTCNTCHNFAYGGKPIPPDQGRFFPTDHGLFWNCHSCVGAATRMSVRDRKRLRDSMARKGLPYTSPLPLPPTKERHRRRMPCYCCECNNGSGGRVLLPSAQGQFLSDHRGERWVCQRCIAENSCAACTSPDEKQLHAWLVSEHISHRMRAMIGGEQFDCHIPDWNLAIELGIWPGRHTATQNEEDWNRRRIAWEQGFFLVHVRWDDQNAIAKIKAGRRAGMWRRERRASSSRTPAYRQPPPVPGAPAWDPSFDV